ncbi:alpha/beta hydrolase [Granulosicoccus sp.]|nr:alpha/beta hydrolase [Granulosicoccus sp.]MDB4222992.1 alpha/beta hydrolase [Granulosicoccus sp.]
MDNALTFHTRFTPEQFDSEYNLRAGRPDYEVTVIPDWQQRSADALGSMDAKQDIRYGEGERQTLNVFSCSLADAPTLVYVHGGYWQRGDKAVYSFLATPFVKAGVNVVVLGYDLCPEVSITRISEEVREAMRFLWFGAKELGINRNRLCVMGHSAGGHLTQMMMATNWPVFDSALPVDLVKVGIPISPLSYLEPVRLTEALNAGLRMDVEEAHDQSPMTNHPPLTNAPQLVVVGGAETSEFHRQMTMYVEKYGSDEREINSYVVPGVDHFDELNVLADSGSEFFEKSLALILRS